MMTRFGDGMGEPPPYKPHSGKGPEATPQRQEGAMPRQVVEQGEEGNS